MSFLRDAFFGERINRKKLERVLAEDTSGSCGLAAVHSATGATREVVDILLRSLCDNDIRGGRMPEKNGIPTGDGAGIMLRTDNDANGRGMQDFLMKKLGRAVPTTRPSDQLLSSLFFIDPSQKANATIIGQKIDAVLARQGFAPLGWKKVSVNPDAVSARARAIMPEVYQLTFGEGHLPKSEMRRALFDARLQIKESVSGTHPLSLQPGTMVWKAMCRGRDLANLYPDLRDEDLISDAGVTHDRFGTNVLAHWRLAQPFDVLAHNGEVNSIRLIMDAMHGLEGRLGIRGSNIMRTGSDSANLDRALQLLHSKAGLPLEEAVRFLVHPSVDDLARIDPEVSMFFRGISRVLGSLKAVGPIALLAMDRDTMTATVDSMGLRPLRWVQRDDGLLVLSSEVGSPRIPPERIVEYGKLGPGGHLFVTRDGHMRRPGIADREIVERTDLNFRDFALQEMSSFRILAAQHRERANAEKMPADRKAVMKKAHLFGLNRERAVALRETIQGGKDPVDGMGSDLALPGFTGEPSSIGRHLRANYSQVTNPSLDYIRSRSAFSLTTHLGRKPKMLGANNFAKKYEARAQYELPDPFLDDGEFLALLEKSAEERPKVLTVSTVFSSQTQDGFSQRLIEMKKNVIDAASEKTHSIIVLSDRDAIGEGDAYIPPHLAVSYLTQALADESLSEFVSFVSDTGEVLDQHEYAMLIACGASAVHPRMIFELLETDILKTKKPPEELRQGLRDSFNGTLLRYMGKLGVPELDEYRGGRYFSALCLDRSFVTRFFGEIPAIGGGFDLEYILQNQQRRAKTEDTSVLRKADERHGYETEIYETLQEVGETAKKFSTPEEAYKAYLEKLDAHGPISFVDLLQFKLSNGGGKVRKSIPLEEVMSREEIIREVLRGASMSLGALNELSHTVISMLFNKYGSYSCSGEGGAHPETRVGEKWESGVNVSRQIASGRFGVDIEYLADPRVKVLEIKIGQGAKPGVGGHLPGEKVMELVAQIRGVGLGQELISPPTNHNIYSLEDLEAFIGHLQACNPAVKIHVKITSGANVGNIANACSKAGASQIQVSGDRGGTGAATNTDKFNTGLPTEWGTSEVDRAFTERGLRDRSRIGVDGGIRCGKDVLKNILLGADEVALGTAILIAQQKCIFCSNCSFQTCPSDITRTRTAYLGQNKKARTEVEEKEQIERLLCAGSHFLELMAEEIRGYMSELGVRDIRELRGRRDLLEIDPRHQELAERFDFRPFLEKPEPVFHQPLLMPGFISQMKEDVAQKVERLRHPTRHDPAHIDFYLHHQAVNDANREIITACQEGRSARLHLTTGQRSVGASAAGLLVKGLLHVPEGGLVIESDGEAGQGYAYAIKDGMTMRHDGPVQNETAEIQSGGKVVILPPKNSSLRDRNNIPLVGNTLAYGARGGDRFIQATIGDRGCVRHTGGRTIITGDTGKYFGEYMTGGRAVLLGKPGTEVGPGMSGGVIVARDESGVQNLSKDVFIPKIMRRRDIEKLRTDLEDLHAETQDAETSHILANWPEESKKFYKIISKGQYSRGLFEYLHAQQNGRVMTQEAHDELIADMFEMCGFDVDGDVGQFTRADMETELSEIFSRMKEEKKLKSLLAKKEPEEEQIFIFMREYAKTAVNEIAAKFIGVS